MFYVRYGGHKERYTECSCIGRCNDCIEIQLVNSNYDKVDRNGRVLDMKPHYNTPVRSKGKRYDK
jgi:hypothetical protein